jgi:DNA-binding transcriptional LysR family regulator
MLNPRRLLLLVELADRGTISAVAEALHFTPSTVSHGLSMLERELGVALLERSPRSVRLTPAARALAQDGRAVLASLGAAEADAQALGRLEGGQLALATFPTAGATLVAAAVARIGARATRTSNCG